MTRRPNERGPTMKPTNYYTNKDHCYGRKMAAEVAAKDAQRRAILAAQDETLRGELSAAQYALAKRALMGDTASLIELLASIESE